MKPFAELFAESREGLFPVPINYKKNCPKFCAYINRQANTVSPKVLFDELIRNALDAVSKQFGGDAKTHGKVCAFPVGRGAFAVTDNGCGIDVDTATTNVVTLGDSGSSPADEALSGTAQHFGIGMKQLLTKFNLYFYSKKTETPIIGFELASLKGGLVDFVGGITMHDVKSLPQDASFAVGEKSRGKTGVGAGSHAKSVRQFFTENAQGTYVAAVPKEAGLKGWQALVTKKAKNQDRAVVRWVNERYAEAPCTIKIARTAKNNDGVGAFLTVTGLLNKFEKAGAKPFLVHDNVKGYGEVSLRFSIGKIDSGSHGDIPTQTIVGMQLHERVILPSMSDSAHKRILAQLGLRHLADRGLRLIAELHDTDRFDMTNDRQHIADLVNGGGVEVSSLVEAIASSVELPAEILEMERSTSAETARNETKGCEDWLKKHAFGGSVNTRIDGAATGGNPSEDRDERRSVDTNKKSQRWCHWPKRENAKPSTNEGQDGGSKGTAIPGHAIVEVTWDLEYKEEKDPLVSFTPPSAAYPAGAVSLCMDHPANQAGIDSTRTALSGSAKEDVSDEIVIRAYQATKKAAIQSQLTFIVTQGIVRSLGEITDEQVKGMMAWSFSDYNSVVLRRNSLLS